MQFIHLTQKDNSHLRFEKAGTYVVFFENYSGEIHCEILSSGVDVSLFGVYRGIKNEQFNISTIQHHAAPGSISNLLIKGVFSGTSRFVYEGLIRLEKGAQQSHAYQKNQNILRSDSAFVDSRPNLEILANDVFCTHGSTTGRLSEAQIEYVTSRGVMRHDAEELLVEGFLRDVYDQVNNLCPDAKIIPAV